MKDEPSHSKHQAQAAPTVIHHYEDDETLLYRWLRRGAEKGARFWFMVAGVIVVVLGLSVLASGLVAGRAEANQAWADLLLAKSPDEQVRLAEAQPNNPAAPWALLQAAEGRYREGLDDLPANHEAAGPLLNRAYELFDQAYREADPKRDADLKRLASFGMARTLEARNELDKAITQYERVANDWPETAEGRQATRLAKQLRQPESVEFYRKLYAFKPKEVTLPPGGSSPLGGILPPDHPALGGPTIPAGPLPSPPGVPSPPDVTPPASPTPGTTPKTGGGTLPNQIFENNPPLPPGPDSSTPAPAPKR
jgi:tetratricopeptide (TPR) repeat protein